MDQIERIQRMEASYSSVKKAMENLVSAIEEYQINLPLLQELSDYYQSEYWMQDYQDDEAGTLPPDLLKGVLSEDGINTLLEENTELLEDLEQLLSVFKMDELY